MAAPNYHNISDHTGSRKNNNSKVHNGLYTSVHKHTGGLSIFTGSMYGFGAGVMFASGSSIAGNAQGGGKFTFVEGGEINFQDFKSRFLYMKKIFSITFSGKTLSIL